MREKREYYFYKGSYYVLHKAEYTIRNTTYRPLLASAIQLKVEYVMTISEWPPSDSDPSSLDSVRSIVPRCRTCEMLLAAREKVHIVAYRLAWHLSSTILRRKIKHNTREGQQDKALFRARWRKLRTTVEMIHREAYAHAFHARYARVRTRFDYLQQMAA